MEQFTLLAELSNNVSLGLATALTVENLAYCMLGVTLGTFLGALPGIGVLIALSMLFPVTFHLPPTAAIIMLGGIYYGTAYGGSIASILLNVPGTPANAVACLDGHPMARQGRAAVALSMTAVSSFIGASIGILVMMFLAPSIAQHALEFGPAEYLMLILLGLLAASTMSGGSQIKGAAMVFFGVALGLVGTDLNSGQHRYTFGLIELRDGLGLLGIAMGVFGVTEIVASIRTQPPPPIDRKDITLRSMLPTRDDVRRLWMPSLRGAGIGSFVGALPGTGSMIASFMSYAVEKRVSSEPHRFGKGAVEGVVGPEAANNAADQTAFIPTLTLGIPGSPALALILGVLLIHGINPGPSMLSDRPDMFWGLVMSFWVGNILLLILNIPLIGIWVRVLSIPYHLLFPSILFFVCIGAFSVNNATFDLWTVAGFAVLGYGMRLLDLPAAPLVLGYVLGPMMEIQFRRTLIFSNGDFAAFIDRPISFTLMLICVAVVAFPILASVWLQRRYRVRLDH